jgi:AraC family transcriptional regulator
MVADEGMAKGIIPAGRYARMLVRGPHDDLEHPANWLYLEWLPASGEEPRDFPLLCERSRIGPQYEPHEMLTELLLPLA